MKILFISFSFPPVADSQSIRNAYFAKALMEDGAEVTVLTGPAHGGDATLLRLLPAGATIERTEFCHYDRVQRWVSRIPFSTLRAWACSGVALAAGKILVPDVRPDWKSRALKLGRRLLSSNRYDAIVSSSGIFAAHEVAGDLAKTSGLPWVAEYGDPWALNPLAPLCLEHIKKKNLVTESRLLQVCRGMTVTTTQTANLYQDWLGTQCPPIEVVTCGFTRLGEPRTKAPGSWLVSYIGTAGRGNRDLRDFMAILDEMLIRNPGWEITLRVVGSYSPAFVTYSNQLGRLKTEFIRWVPYLKSIRLMEESDVLLLYGNSAPIQVPGKLFNYLASGRPVLYLGKLERSVDPCMEYLENHPGVRLFDAGTPPDSKSVEALFSDYSRWESDAARALKDPRFVSQFDWSVVSSRFSRFVCSVVKK